MEVSLDKLPLNTLATIVKNDNLRLRELGLGEGRFVKIIARASFDGPIAIRVDTSCFAFRREELRQVLVIVKEDL